MKWDIDFLLVFYARGREANSRLGRGKIDKCFCLASELFPLRNGLLCITVSRVIGPCTIFCISVGEEIEIK